ncbi:MAG TPA: hypothetical protein PLR88_02145 [Bacteroidales bacterium]|nr:hypothetical protein [Bacteroidales bacterium]
MIKRIFSFLLFTALISSCGNTGKKDVSSKSENSDNATRVDFASLVENPGNFINKNIIVEGKVVHVCTHSGKKMFIVGDNPDVRLFIAAGENMPKFPMELLGSKIEVEGMITRVAGAEVAVNEPKPEAAGDAEKKANGDNCETEAAVAAQSSLADIVMEYKSHTVK